MPGQADFSPITLSRGLAVGTPQNWLWMKRAVHRHAGHRPEQRHHRTSGPPSTSRCSPTRSPRPPSTIPAWFRIYNAWPTALAYSDLDAGANQLLIEQMTLAHEGFDFGLATALGQDAPTPGQYTPAGTCT